MDIILTHEQTDFDGLASTLGAYLLEERATPVLPNNLNRNVQQFYYDYRFELPFVLPQDLPKKSIRSVTLVDTQSMVTLRGMTKKTQVCIFDHHKKREDLDKNWRFNSIDTGACTTYFVEHLIEHNGTLTMIQATLLLLGIYEDTGSLSYASTTARDAQAVAYLLSQGASLKIASEYLNPALSASQQKVLDILIKNNRIVELKKQRIMVSFADAEFLEDEVSSIAHKIGDLYDPDGLFIFVRTREGIRFVARSVSDQINVANIAAVYQGGGHDRAAAALIHHDTAQALATEDLVDEFIRNLDEHVSPAVTVKQIMSTNPLLLEPSIKSHEALKLMQRFGYEGFPVVQDGKVIGLLTRRAVDRAIAHKLDLPAKSLMEAGSYFVHPSTPLEELHQIMARSNWGQIPVMDAEDKQIIGIVTRTDLLQAYSGTRSPENGKINLAAKLEKNLNDEQVRLIKIIAEIAHQLHMHVYIVGGVVRDIILNSSILDLDFVVEGNAIELAHQLQKRYQGRVTSHRQFGTAKWFIEDASILQNTQNKENLPRSVDLISARTEFYKNPSALPTVKLSSIKLDLLRRDFSINTLALRLDGKHYGKLYDYWGGLDDIRSGNIRVLHSLSFVDDPTRMLRAVRFEQRFGFQIESRTIELLQEAKPLLKQVSGDRIRHEIDQILQERLAVDMLKRLQELGLLSTIDPEFQLSERTAKMLQSALIAKPEEKWEIPEKVGKAQTKLIILYTILFCEAQRESTEKILKRLKLSKIVQKSVLQAQDVYQQIQEIETSKSSEIYAILKGIPFYTLYAVHFFFLERPRVMRIFDKHLQEWSKQKTFTKSSDLKKQGVPPGPLYKNIYRQLMSAWIDGEITSKEEELGLLENILAQYKKSGLLPAKQKPD